MGKMSLTAYVSGQRRFLASTEVPCYTINQIRDAFYAIFHLSGELWFNYLGTDEENTSSTENYWNDIVEELHKFDV